MDWLYISKTKRGMEVRKLKPGNRIDFEKKY